MGSHEANTDNARSEMDQWLAVLIPDFTAKLERGFDQQPGLHAGGDALGENAELMPAVRKQVGTTGGGVMRADSQPGPGSGSVKAGVEVEAITKEFPPYSGKYGKLTGSCTIKISISASAGGSTGVASDSKATLKDKKEGRTPGIKQSFSAKDVADLELFKGLSFNNVEIGVEGEISGTEVSVSGSFKFNVVTAAFSAPAQLKLILVKVKLGETVKVAAIELKVQPREFAIKIRGVEGKAAAEFKVSFEVDWKKIGLEIVEKIAKKKLKEEAEKQGVKLLGREAGELVLKDLGPLAAAFSVGLDIGGLLNAYTVAPKVAGAVDDAILGDLNEQYQRADTLGKMWLLSKNSPRIIAALVASGVAGAASGIADVVLFKIMGLPTAKDFEEAFKAFSAGLHVMGEIVKMTGENINKVGPGSIVYGVVMLGIKTNPKHASCAHGSLEPIIAGIFATLHPLYKPNGINELISVRVGDASFGQEHMAKFSKFVFDFKKRMDYFGLVDLTSPETVDESLEGMLIADFLRFLENKRLIKYNVKTDGNMDADEIDPKLLDELYKGTPLENVK
jgi:hypothetical protein